MHKLGHLGHVPSSRTVYSYAVVPAGLGCVSRLRVRVAYTGRLLFNVMSSNCGRCDDRGCLGALCLHWVRDDDCLVRIGAQIGTTDVSAESVVLRWFPLKYIRSSFSPDGTTLYAGVCQCWEQSVYGCSIFHQTV